MMKNNNKGSVHRCVTLDEVQAYMNYTLSPAETEAFEDKVASCDKCLELMESIQKGMLAEAIMQHEPALASQEINTDYEKIWKTAKKQQAQPLRRIGVSLSIAASVIILLVLLWRFLPSSAPPQKISKRHTSSDSLKGNKHALTAPDTNHKKSPSVVKKDSANKNIASKKPVTATPKRNKKDVALLPLKKQFSEDELFQLDAWESRPLAVVDEPTRSKFLTVLNDTIKYQKINSRSSIPKDTAKFFLTVYDSTNIMHPVLENIPFQYEVKQLKVLNKLPQGIYYWLLQDADNAPLKQGKFRKRY